MRLKYILMAALGLVLAVSLTQIFPVYPSAENIFSWYKSGYFSEIDRQYRTIADAFVQIKMSSKPEYAWVFLDDIGKTQHVTVKVYDARGNFVRVAGEKAAGTDDAVLRIVRSMNPAEYSAVRGNVYYSAMPLKTDNRCMICHGRPAGSGIAGVLTFEREFDAKIYYTAERKIIFSIISLLCVVFMFIVYLWDPERRVKELFDK